MNYTRYIKFNYYDNDFMLSVGETIETVFCNEMFNVVMSNADKQNWQSFRKKSSLK